MISIQSIFGRKEEDKEKENQRIKTALEFALNYQDGLFYMFLPRQPPEDLPEAIHCSEVIFCSQISTVLGLLSSHHLKS